MGSLLDIINETKHDRKPTPKYEKNHYVGRTIVNRSRKRERDSDSEYEEIDDSKLRNTNQKPSLPADDDYSNFWKSSSKKRQKSKPSS